MIHSRGDECAVYDIEFELMVVGYRDPVAAGDVAVGDFAKHPVSGEVLEVLEAGELNGRVHLFFGETSRAEIVQAWRDACEGHETTRGAIGDTYYCDGGCVGKGAWR